MVLNRGVFDSPRLQKPVALEVLCSTILQRKMRGIWSFPIRCANDGFRNVANRTGGILGADGSSNAWEIMVL
jgi:hypothetical protein